MNMHTKSEFVKGVAACALLALAGTVTAAPVYWTDWTTATPGDPDLVVGTITGAGPDPVEVTYTGDYGFALVGNTGTNYWSPPGTYADGSVIDNGPDRKDIIGLIGGDATVHTLTFSHPVVDPVMGIVSLGDPWTTVTYDFDAAFDIITNGHGHFGDGPLNELIGQVL
jgi:hypothetical protein